VDVVAVAEVEEDEEDDDVEEEACMMAPLLQMRSGAEVTGYCSASEQR
jgi:hypothetical protein